MNIRWIFLVVLLASLDSGLEKSRKLSKILSKLKKRVANAALDKSWKDWKTKYNKHFPTTTKENAR